MYFWLCPPSLNITTFEEAGEVSGESFNKVGRYVSPKQKEKKFLKINISLSFTNIMVMDLLRIRRGPGEPGVLSRETTGLGLTSSGLSSTVSVCVCVCLCPRPQPATLHGAICMTKSCTFWISGFIHCLEWSFFLSLSHCNKSAVTRTEVQLSGSRRRNWKKTFF